MKTPRRLRSIVSALIALPFIYGGCVVVISSGDHKDKDKDDQNQTLVLAPAAISAENAVELAAGAIVGGPASETPPGPAAEPQFNQNRENAFRTMRLPLALAGALGQIGTDPAAVSFNRSDVFVETGTAAGSCGGQLDYTLDYDRVSESLKGRLEFKDYCVDGVVVSNVAGLDGLFDSSTGDIVSARFTLEDFSVDGLSYDGHLEIDLYDGALEGYLSIETGGSARGETFALSSYFVDVIRHPGFDEVWMSGTYSHPEFGAVELTTTEPFIIHSEDRWPSSGAAVVAGQGETSAALSVVDHTRFKVAADTAGGGFSRYLGMHAWE